MSPVVDPLGLDRCAVCQNAFPPERDVAATARALKTGLIRPGDFLCRRCARDAAVRRALAEAAASRRREAAR